jgi:hypothetical protein
MSRVSGFGNTADVVKRPIHCCGCKGDFYFTLRAIAEKRELTCPHCRATISLVDDAYRTLVGEVQNVVFAISTADLPRDLQQA